MHVILGVKFLTNKISMHVARQLWPWHDVILSSITGQRVLNILTVIFQIEEGLYTRNVCVNRQFWHFAIIISLISNLIFYFQVSRITKDFSV